MASDTPHRVRLRGRDDFVQEGVASATITPGDLVEISGTSSTVSEELQFQRQSTAAEVNGPIYFSIEYAMTGRGIDDDYSSGDALKYYPADRGEVYYGFHNTAEDIAVGDDLVTAGDGTVRALDTAGGDSASAVIAEARSAVANASGTAKSRVEIEVTR